MVFSSIIFIYFFLPITLAAYYLVPKSQKNLVLLISSLIFYFWGEGEYVYVMIMYMVFNYFFGVFIEKYRKIETESGNKRAKAVFILSMVFNLGVLLAFKYLNFIVDNINTILGLFGQHITLHKMHLPIGISFFSFQAMSYVIDVYRGDVKAQKSLLNFSMYKAFFPQLIAGPIVRYRDIADQIVNRKENLDHFVEGVKRFTIGLGKKVLIANNVAAVADAMFKTAGSELSTGFAWAGIIAYALQIYFDFSGYSDMAIGMGKMFGFDFLENFKYPYISKSIQEFWRRWHISLSSWFRDYLYISLGGSRVKTGRIYFNLIVVFFLCGLWHGASWVFVVWGLWHGLFLVLERTKFGRFMEKLPSAIRWIYTVLVVLIGWVFFRAESMNQALGILKVMFTFSKVSAPVMSYLDIKSIGAIILGILGTAPWVYDIFTRIEKFKNKKGQTAALPAFCYGGVLSLIFLVSVIFLSNSTFNPFIYFRF